MTPREREQWLIRVGRGTLLFLFGLWAIVVFMVLIQVELDFINLVALGHSDSWLFGPLTSKQVPQWIAFCYSTIMGWLLTQLTMKWLRGLLKPIHKFLKQYEVRKKPPYANIVKHK